MRVKGSGKRVNRHRGGVRNMQGWQKALKNRVKQGIKHAVLKIHLPA